MARLAKEDQDKFLAEPRIAHLVTIRPAGTPHVAPVWFLWDGGQGDTGQGENGRAWVMADGGAIKVRNIKNNPVVALSIATPERPLSYVVLEGQAQVTTEGLAGIVERMCVLYDGPGKGTDFAKELLREERMVLLGITVNKVMSWKDDD
jgi:PPOX class probable F420-dependent enzyme